MVQLSHPCMTTGKTMVLTRWTFVSKVMSLLLNMLSSFPCGSDGKVSAYNVGDPGSIPRSGSSPGEGKSWIKTRHSETKIMTSGPVTSWQIDGETMETVTDFIVLGSKITADGD